MHRTSRPGAALLLAAALVLAGAGAAAAWAMTGDRGIEERFSHALGLEDGHGEEEEGPVEGNVLLYVAALCILGGGTLLLYRRHPI